MTLSQNKTLENTTLGKDAKDVGRTPKTVSGEICFKKIGNRFERYKLLKYAQFKLIEENTISSRGNVHRTRTCHSARHYLAEAVTIKLSENEKSQAASFGNVQTCANVWSCPVCAPRIAQTRGEEVKKAIAWARPNGYLPIMITLTARHNQTMALETFKDQFKQAWRKFAQTRKWRDFKDFHGFDHAIKACEVTHGKNGWHYHYHILVFAHVDKYDCSENDWLDIADLWVDKLHRVGLDGIKDYAFDVRTDKKVPNNYLAKMGLNVTEAQYELTSTGNKIGSGLTQWQLLKRYARGDEQSGKLFAEFSRVMCGEYWCYWSNGFKDLVDIDSVTDEEASENENHEEAMFHWMEIDDQDMVIVRKNRCYAEILEIAASTRSKTAVWEFIESLTSLPDGARKIRVENLWLQWRAEKMSFLRFSLMRRSESKA